MSVTKRLFSLLLLLSLAFWPSSSPIHAQTRYQPHPDFNGDGYADLAVGIPLHDIRDSRGTVLVANAGAVNVFYGSASRLRADGAQMWTQDSTLFNDSVRGTASLNDNFGAAIGVGDFNDDGYDDLAVGVPGEEIGGARGAGGVNVLYGSAVGLTASRNQLWHQGAVWFGSTTPIRGIAQAGDAFGSALTTGDFNDDDYDDLAIGVPGETVNGFARAGSVNLIYGSASGLVAAAAGIPENQRFNQESGLPGGQSAANDQFGFSLAAGDFDADGDDDLAIGVPFETVFFQSMAGAVYVMYATDDGLTTAGALFLSQDTWGIQGIAEAYDRFGYSLAAGDFIGYYADGAPVLEALVVGIPGESVTEEDDCLLVTCLWASDADRFATGAIQVIYGTAWGLGTRDRIFHQGTPDVPGRMEAGDQFGTALSVGDYNGDGVQDVAVGVPWEDVDRIDNAGMIVMLLGGFDGLRAAGSSIHQGDGLDTADTDDHFGAALSSGDFNGDGIDELAVSVPREDVDGLTDAGEVNVLAGTLSGLSGSIPQGAQILFKHTVANWWVAGVSAPAAFDHFGGHSPMR